MTLIKNQNYISRVVSFDGLNVGKIYPTDIDFVWEIDDKFLILGEVKSEDAPITVGQSILLERIVDSWVDSGKKGTAIRVSTPKGEGNIILKDCLVTDVYMGGTWNKIRSPKSVAHFMNTLIRKWDIQKLKVS